MKIILNVFLANNFILVVYNAMNKVNAFNAIRIKVEIIQFLISLRINFNLIRN